MHPLLSPVRPAIASVFAEVVWQRAIATLAS